MRVLPIEPLTSPFDQSIPVPGSKSITNRALLIAALAEGRSLLRGALFSDDTQIMSAALRSVGIPVRASESEGLFEVQGCAGRIPGCQADIFVGNAGTAARFLTALLSLGRGTYRFDSVSRMRARPMRDLLSVLRMLGSDFRCESGADRLPFALHAQGIAGGHVPVRGDASSQFLSALLMVSPYAAEPLEILVDGDLVSKPYIDLTLRVMEQWGVATDRDGYSRFSPATLARYQARDFSIEPDASSASYFFAAAAVTGGRVRVDGLGSGSLQGDLKFVDVLEAMGCEVTRETAFTEVRGPNVLVGTDADMNGISDTVMTLAAIAPFASSATTIRNIEHIRHKETDRMDALLKELKRLGADASAIPGGIEIKPTRDLRPACIQTYDDHRMAMSFAIAGLKAPGISIENPACVAKTYPAFFEHLDRLRSR